jgi:hypothetical protein
MSTPSTSSDYQFIRQAVEDENPIAAKYKGKDRKLWPLVIGTSPKPGSSGQQDEMVLCFEFEPTPPAGWRCFKIKLFNAGSLAITTGTGRPVLTEREVERQSCVQDVDLPNFP